MIGSVLTRFRHCGRSCETVIPVPFLSHSRPFPPTFRAASSKVLSEPFSYDLDGTEILMTTLSIPIESAGEVIGVVGIDIPLNSFQEIIETIHPFETGYAFVVSHDETVVITVPLEIAGFEKSWGLGISSPLTKVQEQQSALVRNGLIMGIVFALIAIVVIFLLVRSNTTPIIKISEQLETISTGDLTSEIPRYTRKDEVGILAKSLETLVQNLNRIVTDVKSATERAREPAL